MKRAAYIFVLVLFMATGSFAQNGERVNAIKVAYITDKLHLTTDQAARFWPIYNSYDDEMNNARKGFLQRYKDIDLATTDEKTARRFIDENFEMQEQELAAKRKYKDEFLKVITARQLAVLYRSEREFKQMLIQQLKDHRASTSGGPQR